MKIVKKIPHYVMYEYKNELNEIIITTTIAILTIFLWTTNTNYIENITSFENINLEKNNNIFTNCEKLNLNSSIPLENDYKKINTNFDIIKVNMMNDLNHQNWNNRVNNMIIMLQNLNNQNILTLIFNNNNLILNQADILLLENPNLNNDRVQLLEDELKKFKRRLIYAKILNLSLISGFLIGTLYSIRSYINRIMENTNEARKAAQEFREIGDNVINFNWPNLSQNRVFLSYITLFGISFSSFSFFRFFFRK